MRVCVFCKTRYQKGSGITFHKFPTDDTKRLWVKNMKFVNWSPKSNDYLCSKHFTEDCFIRQLSRTTLEKFSVPTIFSADKHSKNKGTVRVTAAPFASGTTIDAKRILKSDIGDSDSDSEARTDIEEKDPTMSHPSTSYDTKQSETPKRPRTVAEIYDNIKMDHRYDDKSRVAVYQHIKRDEDDPAPTFRPAQCLWSVNFDATEWSVRACRICLAAGVKLRVMAPLNRCYHTFYALTEGCHWAYVCCECLEHLVRIHNFREKCLRTNGLLEAILQTEHEITQEAVELINREENQLVSPLKMTDLDYWETVGDDNMADTLKSDSGDDSNTEYVRHDAESGKDGPLREYHATEFMSVTCDGDEEDDKPLTIYSHNKEDEKKVKLSKKSNSNKRADKPTKILKEVIDCYNKSTKIGKLAMKRIARAEFFSRFADRLKMSPAEAREAITKRKEGRNYRLATYKCELCFKGFWEKGSFKNHMMRHDTSQGEFECDLCHVRYRNRHLLLRHIAVLHTWKFCCRKCPNVCTEGSSAERHEAWHNGTQYRCQHCGQEFSHYTSMKNHVRIKHATESSCRLCGLHFVGERGVRFHMFKAHGTSQVKLEDGGHPCVDCDISFATVEALKRHRVVSSKHNLRETDNGCEACGEIFPTADEFRQHHSEQHARNVPAEVKRYWLNERRKRLGLPPLEDADLLTKRSWSRRKKYFNKDTEQKKSEATDRTVSVHVCEICGKVFQSAQGLGYHQHRHTGERPFPCGLCQKTFVQRALLQAHMRVHTNERPYKCNSCELTFTQGGNLKRHQRHVHSEVKPVRCDICSKMLKNTLCLKDHIKYVHMKVPYPVRRGRKQAARAKKSDAD